MKRTLPILCFALLAFVVACGGDNDGGTSDALDIFFAPENADALAHASLPTAADLPGGGWEVTGQDDFGDDDADEGFDFEAFAASEPACSQLTALVNVGGLFGSSDEELPAGRAQIEFESVTPESLLPNSVEVEVEIEETAAEVQGAWNLVKDLFESDRTEACMLAVFNQVFGGLADEDLKVEVEAAQASSDAPNNGATMAFDLHLDITGIELDMAMEMYLWPYGNAKVTTTFIGTPDSVNGDLTGPALDAVVEKLEAAAASGG